jgi:hypothetical protein
MPDKNQLRDMPDKNQPIRGQPNVESKVHFLTNRDPPQTFVLVKYGEESGQTRNSLALTITVARNQSKTISDLSFLANIHTAKEIAKREGISNIFVWK